MARTLLLETPAIADKIRKPILDAIQPYAAILQGDGQSTPFDVLIDSQEKLIADGSLPSGTTSQVRESLKQLQAARTAAIEAQSRGGREALAKAILHVIRDAGILIPLSLRGDTPAAKPSSASGTRRRRRTKDEVQADRDKLIAALTSKPQTAEEIAQKSGIDIAVVGQDLLILTEAKMLKKQPGQKGRGGEAPRYLAIK